MTFATMTVAEIAVLAVSAAGAATAAYAGYEQSKTTKRIAEHNADTANVQAADALARGEKAKIDARKRGSMIEGQQRAALASRGLSLDEGTASDVLAETNFFSLSDQATAGDNAKREAWAKKAQSANYQMSADATNPGLQLAGSLLSSGGSVASRWYTPTKT